MSDLLFGADMRLVDWVRMSGLWVTACAMVGAFRIGTLVIEAIVWLVHRFARSPRLTREET